jgi:limonene-1,2-epoxide hydrolase
MRLKEIIREWVETFNTGDSDKMAEFYADEAINHQVNQEPTVGKRAIRQKFNEEFETADMVCIIENIFEDGDWAILEWKDPLGLRGCGFFKFNNDKIIFQRGYWDMLSFLRQHKLPLPKE